MTYALRGLDAWLTDYDRWAGGQGEPIAHFETRWSRCDGCGFAFPVEQDADGNESPDDEHWIADFGKWTPRGSLGVALVPFRARGADGWVEHVIREPLEGACTCSTCADWTDEIGPNRARTETPAPREEAA